MSARRGDSQGSSGHRARYPHAVRRGIGVVLCVLLALLWAVWTAQTTQYLGPHSATYVIAGSGEVKLDLGPLGTVRLDSPAPLGLGIDITVKEIPADLAMLDGQTSTDVDLLLADLNEYILVFTGLDSTVHQVVQGLVLDIVLRTLVATFVLLGASWLLWRLLGAARRREVVVWLQSQRGRLIAGIGIGLVSVLVLTSSSALPERPKPGTTANSLAGTALQDVRFTGRLAQVLVGLSEEISGALTDNSEYYRRAEQQLIQAWQHRWELDFAPGGPGLGASDPDPAERDLATFLLVSDLHCNVSMTALIHTAARLSQADAVLNLGDTTMSGTDLESYCINSFNRALPDDVAMIMANGNHDSQETVNQAKDLGWIVLEGEVIEYAGVRILGDVDPFISKAGTPTTLAGSETLEEMAARLAQQACSDEDGIDLLLTHTPRVGEATLEAGCAPLHLAGHYHRRVGPTQLGQGLQYINSSTAGATLNQPTVGKLSGPAQMTVMRFDRESRTWVDYQVLTVFSDQQAEVGARISLGPGHGIHR